MLVPGKRRETIRLPCFGCLGSLSTAWRWWRLRVGCAKASVLCETSIWNNQRETERSWHFSSMFCCTELLTSGQREGNGLMGGFTVMSCLSGRSLLPRKLALAFKDAGSHLLIHFHKGLNFESFEPIWTLFVGWKIRCSILPSPLASLKPGLYIPEEFNTMGDGKKREEEIEKWLHGKGEALGMWKSRKEKTFFWLDLV